MINRREFITSALSTMSITGPCLIREQQIWASEPDAGQYANPEQCQLFSSDRIVVLKPSFKVAALRKSRVLKMWGKDNQRCRMEFSELPKMPDAKIDLLLALVDVLAGSYSEANFYEWAKQLVLREDFCSTALDNHLGIFHQFQAPDPIITLQGNQADWWLFLCPEGTEYDAFDDKPAHVLFGFVMPARNPHLECIQMLRFTSLERYINEEGNLAHFWKAISRQSPASVARLLNDIMTRCSQTI